MTFGEADIAPDEASMVRRYRMPLMTERPPTFSRLARARARSAGPLFQPFLPSHLCSSLSLPPRRRPTDDCTQTGLRRSDIPSCPRVQNHQKTQTRPIRSRIQLPAPLGTRSELLTSAKLPPPVFAFCS